MPSTALIHSLLSFTALIHGSHSQLPFTGIERAALCAFNSETVHAADLATFLDQDGIAVRAGHHCTQPLHRELGASGSARASLYIYNTEEEIDAFVDALGATLDMFAQMGM